MVTYAVPSVPNPYSKSPPLLCPVAPYGVTYPERDTPKETTTGMRKPMLDPKRDLAGATPETLARALLRPAEGLRPGRRGKPVVGDEIAVEEVTTDQSGDGVPHLRDGV